VKADRFESAEEGFCAIAKILIPNREPVLNLARTHVFEMVREYLERPETLPWLLILDDADDTGLFLGESEALKDIKFRLMDYLPSVNKGQIMITTRDSRIAGLEGGQIVLAPNLLKVMPMNIDDGYALFQKCMPTALTVSKDKCRDFLDMLGGLPLAIVQATSYMREEHISVDEPIGLYKDTECHKELFQNFARSVDKEQKSVLVTWEISYERIAGSSYQPGHPESKSQTAVLLDLLGFLDAQDSPLRKTLSEAEFAFKDETGPTPVDGLEHLFEGQQNPSRLLEGVYNTWFKPNGMFRTAIGRLCTYSLITERECWVHPVVHSWIYRRLSLDERCKYITWLVDELLKHIVMEELDSEERWDTVIPANINALIFGKFSPIRHARFLATLALSNRVLEYMTAHHISTSSLGELVYRIGQMEVSMGRAEVGISYLEIAIKAMKNFVHPTVISERRLHLAKIRSRLVSEVEATDEARLCVGDIPSPEATLWLAQCLRTEGHKIEALELFENIIQAFPIAVPADFSRNKEILAANIGAAYTLADLGDLQGDSRARDIIDHSIQPFIGLLPYGHLLKTIVYPKILICRAEVAADPDDQASALSILIEHDE